MKRKAKTMKTNTTNPKHPLALFLAKRKTSIYKLAQVNNIGESTIRMIITRNTPINNISVGIINMLADTFKMTLDAVYNELKGSE